MVLFLSDSLPIIKDGACVINPDDRQSIRTYSVLLFTDRNTAMYFDSFFTYI